MRIIAAGVSEAIVVKLLAMLIATESWEESPTSIIAKFVWEEIPGQLPVSKIAIPIGVEPPQSIYAGNALEAPWDHKYVTKTV